MKPSLAKSLGVWGGWAFRLVVRSFAVGVLIGSGVLVGRPALAFTHIVHSSETLAGIAERYYGKIQYEKILVYANDLQLCGGSAIVPGMRLEIPAMEHHRVVAGETWPSLAKTWLGDENRAGVMARANKAKPWIPPDDGTDIVVPYTLRFIVQHRETAPSIAKRFYKDLEDAWMLDQYNQIHGKALRRGDVVLVPLMALPLTEEGKRAARRARKRQQSQGAGQAMLVQRKVEQQMPALKGELRGGHYLEALVRANRMLGLGELTTPQLATVYRVLTEAYVAVGARGLAVEACDKWRHFDKGVVLEPVMTSPKILAVCQLAKGAQ